MFDCVKLNQVIELESFLIKLSGDGMIMSKVKQGKSAFKPVV